jgi:arylsulfatase
MQLKLFDLENDIQEQHDIAEQHPEIVKKIEDIMKKEHHTAEVKSFRMEVLDKD